MRVIGLYISLIVVLSVSCNGTESKTEIDNGVFNSEAFLIEMKSIDSVLATGIPEKEDLKKAIVMYQDFAKHFPDDPKSPNYLFQVSDFYLNMGNSKKSVNVLTGIIEKYPNYDRIETIYFVRASHVDLDLRDTVLAKTYYQEFLELYPDSKYAKDANTRLENVGLSMEDLIKKFEEMNVNN